MSTVVCNSVILLKVVSHFEMRLTLLLYDELGSRLEINRTMVCISMFSFVFPLWHEDRYHFTFCR